MSLGEEPAITDVFPGGLSPEDLVPMLRSEFGTYGSLGYTQVSVYF